MSAAAAVSRTEKKAQSRRRILDAARIIFFRDGFVATNLDKVADHAGVAKGTLYRYFESKADLYVAVLSENGRAFIEKLGEVDEDTNLEAVRARIAHGRARALYLDVLLGRGPGRGPGKARLEIFDN